MRDAAAWRHLYTWSPRGLLGRPGFQTVACADALSGDRRLALERLVAGLRPPPPEDHPVLALQPLPTDRGRCVLTRAVATGAAADGRPGNYWAESLVVPEAWLAAAAWDLPAAFAALDWWGPRDPAALARGGGPEDLPDENVPDLAPRPPRRLARLPEIVPDAEVRRALLEVVAWQGQDGGREQPIHVVAAPETAAAELEELLLALPATLPRAALVRGRDGERRCLRLVTRGEPGAVAGADLVGVPAADLDAARGARGLTVDLGGGVPPPDSGDRAARQWARTVDERIAAGDWDALAALREPARQEAARREPAPRQPETRRRVRPADSTETTSMARETRREPRTEGEAAGGGTPDGREARWRLREEGEAAGSELLAALRRDHEQLLETMRELFEEQRQRVEAELESHVGAAVERLRGEAETAQRDLREQADAVISTLRSARGRSENQIREAGHAAVDQLQTEVGRAKSALDAERRRGTRELAAYAGVEPRDLTGPEDARDGRDEDWEEGEPRGGAARAAGKKSQHRPGGGERLRQWLTADRRRVARIVIPLLTALIVLAALWLTRDRWRDAPAEPAPAGTPATAASPEALRESLLERLQDPALAGRLVAATHAVESLRPEATAAWLDVTLAHRDLGDAGSCALLQASLRRRLVEVGRPALTVDGDCGPNTQRSLAAEAPAIGCGAGDFETQAACFLERRIARALREDCRPEWPFERNCRWRPEEASRMLELVRDAAAVAPFGGMRWQPARGPMPETLDETDAGRLLQLAYLADQAARGEVPPSAPRLEVLTRDELQAIAGYLDRLPPAAGAAEDAAA